MIRFRHRRSSEFRQENSTTRVFGFYISFAVVSVVAVVRLPAA